MSISFKEEKTTLHSTRIDDLPNHLRSNPATVEQIDSRSGAKSHEHQVLISNIETTSTILIETTANFTAKSTFDSKVISNLDFYEDELLGNLFSKNECSTKRFHYNEKPYGHTIQPYEKSIQPFHHIEKFYEYFSANFILVQLRLSLRFKPKGDYH